MTKITVIINRRGLSRKPLSKMTEDELKKNMALIQAELDSRPQLEGLGALFG